MFKNREHAEEFILDSGWKRFLDLMILDGQIKFKDSKPMQHEKKKMTRKEVIEIFKKHMPIVRNPESTIDFYIETGMLEIVEEVEPKDNTRQALCSIITEIEVRKGPYYGDPKIYPSEYGAGCLIDGLKMKGYKIVKDDT